MGDWAKAKREFDREVERELAERDRLKKIEEDLRKLAERLERDARRFVDRGNLAQARKALDGAENALLRADQARQANAAAIFQIDSAVLGKMRAYSIFAREFKPQ